MTSRDAQVIYTTPSCWSQCIARIASKVCLTIFGIIIGGLLLVGAYILIFGDAPAQLHGPWHAIQGFLPGHGANATMHEPSVQT